MAKSMTQFVREHRADIDQRINAVVYRYDGKGGRGTVPCPPPKRNDAERRQWILNDECLYTWAKSEGVQC